MSITGKSEMKAVVVKAPMDFSYTSVPVPETPDKGMLLKVEACGLCGSDLRTLRSGHRRVTFPWILGHEISGTVVDSGNEYEGTWKEGDLLAVGPNAYCGSCDYCLKGEFELCENHKEIAQDWPGGFAEYVAIPYECVRLGNIRKVPRGVNPDYAAITEPISSCVNAQEKAGVTLGDTVVIIGTGPIGCIHISLARTRGAFKIIVIDINDERLKLAEKFEPDNTINASKTDPVSEVLRLTGGKGAEVVIDATPAPIASVQAVQMAAKGGRVVQFGGLPKDNSKPNIDMNLVHYNGLHVIGTTAFAPKHFFTALKLVASNKIPMEKLVTHVLPLSEFGKGVKLAMDGKALKVVFKP